MAVEVHVLLRTDRLPDAQQWQSAIDSLGFDMKLDHTLVVEKNTGFLPAKFKGRNSGFEFDVSPASDIIESYPAQAAKFVGVNRSANFRWGGNLNEMACALVAAAALTKIGTGIWFYPADEMVLDAAGALQQVREGVATAK
jgi:hypothetical protein